jgi:3-phenylpropionate/trans-cinnamate dioxygenase ferredoxin reductase component
MERLVIVGGSAAGSRAAQAAVASGFAGRIDVLSRDAHAPYYRPGVSKQLLKGTWSQEQAAQPVPAGDHLEWHRGVSAVGLDAAAGTVALDDGRQLPFDRLVLAGGCRPRRLVAVPIGGRLCEATTIEDVARIRATIGPGSTVLVVGAGLIGSEVASTLLSVGAAVTVVDPSPAPLLRALGPIGNEVCLGWTRESGIDLRLGVPVEQIEDCGDRVRATLGGGEVVEAAVAIVCVGVVPDTDWLRGTGLPLFPDGGIACDEHLVVEGSDLIAAAGDAASWRSRLLGRPTRVEHWMTAIEQGAAAARNVLAPAGDRVPFDGLPTFWTEQHDRMVHVLGHHGPESTWTTVEEPQDGRGMVAAALSDGETTGFLLVDAARRLGHYRKELLAQRTVRGAA